MCVNRHTVNNSAYSEIISMPDPHITKWQSNSYCGMAAIWTATVGITPDGKYMRWGGSTQSRGTSSLCDEAYLKMIQLCDQLWHANSWPCWCSVGMVFSMWWPHSISDGVTGSFPYKLSNSEAVCWTEYNYAGRVTSPILVFKEAEIQGIGFWKVCSSHSKNGYWRWSRGKKNSGPNASGKCSGWKIPGDHCRYTDPFVLSKWRPSDNWVIHCPL